jgi:hypothetical protein
MVVLDDTARAVYQASLRTFAAELYAHHDAGYTAWGNPASEPRQIPGLI